MNVFPEIVQLVIPVVMIGHSLSLVSSHYTKVELSLSEVKALGMAAASRAEMEQEPHPRSRGIAP